MQDGDFIKMEYVGRVAATGEIFDLTDEELARKEGIHNPKQTYGPVLVIIGSGMTPKGVEKHLKGMKPGEEREFDLSQEEGFGRREPGLIKIVSLQKFYSQKINPIPGEFVQIDGRHARIQSVSGGRVRVDFNSPLAGKELHYRIKLVEKVTGTQDMAQALLDNYDMKAKATFKEGSLTIGTKDKVPEQLRNLLNMQFKRWIPAAKKINYVNLSEKPGKTMDATPDKKAGKADPDKGTTAGKPIVKAGDKASRA